MTVVRILLPAVVALATALGARAEPAGLLRADASSLILENRRADEDDLSRMSNLSMVRRFAREGLLVPVPNQTRHFYLRNIPAAYRYLRPWSKRFLNRLSQQFHARFQKPLRVTSLERTVSLQSSLARRNGNAASARGPRRSSHLTGATVDVSKKGMTRAEIDWMRRVLHSLKTKEYIHAIEEFQQSAFHVMVFKDYPQYVKASGG